MKRLLAIALGLVLATAVHASVWINEIDYDTEDSDTNEWVEIVGTAGLSLDSYELVLINQAGSEYTTVDLADASWTFTDEDDGHGFFVMGLVQPSHGVSPDFTPTGWTDNEIQNGGTDSVQLRLKAGSVNVHLLDYEGDNPNTTEDQQTALADNNSDLETSLYLTGGPGNDFGDFSWANGQDNGTPGALNAGQTISAVPEPSTMALIAVALGVVGALRRRR